ncbi:MAG TPA: M28 family peptidase [Bacteroidota bacterium]|nr:M28 family peptidase [Bacteroidota bacterium]
MTHTPEFDGNQAFTYLTAQTNCGPRNPNSAGHEKCLQYLATTLDGLAAKVTRQEFTVKGYDGEALKLTNIFASFNPDDTARILFLAHWDTRPRADEEKDVALQDRPIPGANDGASGVAILLELAAMMKKNPPPIGVDLLLVDGEDYGTRHDLDNYFLGSKHFMEVKPASYKPRFAILLDMVGYRDLRIPMEQNSMQMAPAVVELLWSTAERVGVTQFVNIPGDQISDDHLALNKGGIPTADVIDFQYPYWHTLKDTPDKCSAESLEAVGTVLAHVIYESSLHRAQ